MSKKCPNCGSRKVDIDCGLNICQKCNKAWKAIPRKKPTLFDHITQSPEVLAPQFIFKQWHAFDGKWGWFSLLLMDGDELNSPWFDSYEKALAATVARLKEVIK